MTDLPEHSTAVEAPHPVRLERRRPGRMADVPPSLIPLLRGDTEPSFDYEAPPGSDLTPATGIAVSVLISGLMWAILFWII
jgi:hypothetical protein